ncbi:hypothetical protein TUM4438_10480 [Shewanella sairae]|uniref:Uncharacterized protein n=1 Tax=Shewanella sairae TaxID=190310 RepID=A0ABQ4P5Z5_9GAMM|nr:hypothetical protein TUM4438_10480 [Shewanella sairae]
MGDMIKTIYIFGAKHPAYHKDLETIKRVYLLIVRQLFSSWNNFVFSFISYSLLIILDVIVVFFIELGARRGLGPGNA